MCVCVCVRVWEKVLRRRQTRGKNATDFFQKRGWFLHAHVEQGGFLLADKVYAGVQGQSRHTRMIDGSV